MRTDIINVAIRQNQTQAARTPLGRLRSDLHAFPRHLAIIGGFLIAGLSWMSGTPTLVTEHLPTKAEQAQRIAALAHAAPLLLPVVEAGQRAQAIHSMGLTPEEGSAFKQTTPELVWLTLWDDCAEDGDRVAIESGGARLEVALRHAPQRVAVPRPSGGFVSLQGVFDGGGGITAAVATTGGPLPLPRLMPGQTIHLPVR